MPGLIQRLADAGRGVRTPPALLDMQDTVNDVIENLSRIFNCRVETAPAQMDLGIPSPHELLYDYPESATRFRDALAHSVARYEPRLKQVRIVIEERAEEDLSIHFTINGYVQNSKGDRMVINFETSVNQSGQVDVQG